MADRLIELVNRCNADPDVRVVILTGAGEKAFCAGSDISELDDYSSPWDFRNRPDYCDAIRRLNKPIICAVNGYALGGGLETAMSCDIRLAAANARFGAPEIKLGCYPPVATVALPALVGQKRASELILTGRQISGDEAVAIGLANRSARTEELETVVQETLAKLRHMSPASLAHAS